MDSSYSRESARLSFSRIRPIRAAKSCIKVVEEKLGLYPEVPPWKRRIQVGLTALSAYGTFAEISELSKRDMPEELAYFFGALASFIVLYAFSRGVGESFRNSNAVGPRFELQNRKIKESKELYQAQELTLRNLEHTAGLRQESPLEENVLATVSLPNTDTPTCPSDFRQRCVKFFYDEVWFVEGTSLCQKFLQVSGIGLSALMGYDGTSLLAKHLMRVVTDNSIFVGSSGYIVGTIGGLLSASTARCVLMNNDVYRNSAEKREAQSSAVANLVSIRDQHELRIQKLERKEEKTDGVVKIADLPVIQDVLVDTPKEIKHDRCTRYIADRLRGLSHSVAHAIEQVIYPGLSWPDRLVQSGCTILYAYLGYIVPHDDLSQAGYDTAGIIVGAVAVPVTLINCYNVISFNFQQAKAVAKNGQAIADVTEDAELQQKRIQRLQKNTSDEQKASAIQIPLEENDSSPGASRCSNICNWSIFNGFRRSVTTLKRMVSRQNDLPANDVELAVVKRAPT